MASGISQGKALLAIEDTSRLARKVRQSVSTGDCKARVRLGQQHLRRNTKTIVQAPLMAGVSGCLRPCTS